MRSLFFLFVTFCQLNTWCQDYERYKRYSDTTFKSLALGYDRELTITVPFEWQKNVDKKFPVVLIFDRQNPRSHNYIINSIDYLTSNEQMPASIIIGIESTVEHRRAETTHLASHLNGLAAANESFIFEELLPFVENELNGSQFRILIGHSRYGYFTTALMHSRLNDLNAVIAMDPFFEQDNVNLCDSIAALANVELTSKKFYQFAIGEVFKDQYECMKKHIDSSTNPNLIIKGTFFPEADHNVVPGLTINSALYTIFEEWSKYQNIYLDNDFKDLEKYVQHQEFINTYYGHKIGGSLGYLNGKGWYFYGEEDYPKAIQAWEILMKEYPNFADGLLFILDAEYQMNGKINQETKQRFLDVLNHSEIHTKEEKSELLKELELLE